MRAPFLCLLLLSTNAVAAERELNGHLFIPSLSIRDPFLATTFGLTTGAGYAWVDGPGFDLRGDATGRDSFKAAALGETTSFQVRLLKWWALRLVGSGGLYGGANAKSALVVGATTQLNISPGTSVSWKLCRFLRAGATFDYIYEDQRTVDPLGAVQRSLLVNAVDLTQARLTLKTHYVLPGVAAAFAPHRSLGLVASLQYEWFTRTDGTVSFDTNNIVFGATADFDLKQLVPKLPLAIVASYSVTAPISSPLPLSQLFEGGLYYSGRDQLVLGLVARVLWFDIRPDFDTTALVINWVLRYYWN